jgi:tetratricopeptide (TPR) repeat protein
MVDRFKDTADAQTAFFAAWTTALGPGALPDFSLALRLAERAAAADAKDARYQQAVGAVLYRMGRVEESLKRFDAAQAATTNQAITSAAYWAYFRAMAHHRLGHKEQARKWLEQAVARSEKELREYAQNPIPERWVRRATLRLLRAEAEALLRQVSAGRDK